MTNNFDEFDHQDMEHAEEVAAPRGAVGNLGEAWRTKPLFKLMVLMVGVAAVVAVSVTLFSGSKSGESSTLVHPPNLHEAPGGAVSPFMKQQQDMANKEREKTALETGESAISTPVGATTDLDLEKKNEALKELTSETEHLKQQLADAQKQTQQAQQQTRVAPPPQQQPTKPEQFDESLAQAMQQQMKQLTDSWTPHGMKEVQGKTLTDDKSAVAGGNANGAPGTQNGTAAAAAPVVEIKDLISAGTVSYGQLLTEANSDVPGPILAQILSGPLAGARAVGAFQTKNEYLVLQFTSATLKGVDYNINVIALDPDTTLGGLATEVDERYFTRVILPAAASFMQGLGQGLGQGNSSLTTNGTTTIASQTSEGVQQGMYQGLGQAAQTAGQFFQQQANQTKVLVRVAAGTPIGLFFVKSVQNTAAQDQAIAEQNAVKYNTGAAGYGYQPAGAYPGGAATGYGGAATDVPYPNFASTPARGYGYGGGYPTTTFPAYGH